jgi:prepilin-type processing-associated H-X9-DG protein
MTIFAVELAEVSPSGFATADHVHPETWFGNPANHDATLARQMQIDQHLERANYTYLDGHAETQARPDVFEVAPGATLSNPLWSANHFWPDVAR